MRPVHSTDTGEATHVPVAPVKLQMFDKHTLDCVQVDPSGSFDLHVGIATAVSQ
jgi:hypothetical protein